VDFEASIHKKKLINLQKKVTIVKLRDNLLLVTIIKRTIMKCHKGPLWSWSYGSCSAYHH